MFEIEKGIAPPKTRLGFARGAFTMNSFSFENMEVGDSIFIADANHEHPARWAAAKYFKRHNKKMTAKIENGGLRIWRTE